MLFIEHYVLAVLVVLIAGALCSLPPLLNRILLSQKQHFLFEFLLVIHLYFVNHFLGWGELVFQHFPHFVYGKWELQGELLVVCPDLNLRDEIRDLQ